MNLSQFLRMRGFPRNTYNTHVKRAGLDFMKSGHDGGGRKIEFWQFVAFELFFEIFRSGCAPAIASRWVSVAADQLRELVENSDPGEPCDGWFFSQAWRSDNERDHEFRVGVTDHLPQFEPRNTGRVLIVSLFPVIRYCRETEARFAAEERAAVEGSVHDSRA